MENFNIKKLRKLVFKKYTIRNICSKTNYRVPGRKSVLPTSRNGQSKNLSGKVKSAECSLTFISLFRLVQIYIFSAITQRQEACVSSLILKLLTDASWERQLDATLSTQDCYKCSTKKKPFQNIMVVLASDSSEVNIPISFAFEIERLCLRKGCTYIKLSSTCIRYTNTYKSFSFSL